MFYFRLFSHDITWYTFRHLLWSLPLNLDCWSRCLLYYIIHASVVLYSDVIVHAVNSYTALLLEYGSQFMSNGGCRNEKDFVVCLCTYTNVIMCILNVNKLGNTCHISVCLFSSHCFIWNDLLLPMSEIFIFCTYFKRTENENNHPIFTKHKYIQVSRLPHSLWTIILPFVQLFL